MTVPKLLTEYLASCRGLVFDWGYSNCIHFVGGWAFTLTGENPTVGLPIFNDYPGWVRLVHRSGGIGKLVDKRLGWPRRDALHLQQGDIILAKGSSESWMFGICAGRQIALVGAASGLSFGTPEITLAWAHP